MDRGAWQATVHGVARIRHDLATKPPRTTSQYSCVGVYVMRLPTHPSKNFALLKKRKLRINEWLHCRQPNRHSWQIRKYTTPSLTYALAGLYYSANVPFFCYFSVLWGQAVGRLEATLGSDSVESGRGPGAVPAHDCRHGGHPR